MSITSISQTRGGGAVIVTAISSLAVPVYFFWYLDGAYVGKTGSGTKSFLLNDGDQATVDVLDSTDPAFDPIANAPVGYPARRSIVFVRSIDPNIARYRIEQQIGGGAWTAIGFISHDPSRWSYNFLTDRLNDLTQYAFRVVPMDSAGNDGTPFAIGQELIVRTPDAPNFTAVLQISTKVAFAAA